MEIIDKVVAFIGVYLPVIISVVGSFSLIASTTPNKTDNKIAQFLANNEFIKALNNYIEDNYSNVDIKNLNNHEAIKGVDIRSSGSQGKLYRGLFFNNTESYHPASVPTSA